MTAKDKRRQKRSAHLPMAPGGAIFFFFVAISAALTVSMILEVPGHLFSFPNSVDDAAKEDFPVFYRIYDFARSNSLIDAYDLTKFSKDSPDGQLKLPWLYPPHAVYFFAVFGVGSYGVGKFALFLLTGLAIFFIVKRIERQQLAGRLFLTSISPGVFVCAVLTQLGVLATFGVLSAAQLAKSYPLRSGILLAVLTMKPQYGIILPVFLIAFGYWRAICYGAIFATIIIAISIADFGIEPWVEFLRTAVNSPTGASGPVQPQTASIGQLVSRIGFDDRAAMAAQLAIIPIAWLLMWRIARHTTLKLSMAMLLLLSILAAPSSWAYDWMFIIAAMLMLGAGECWPRWLQVMAGIAWIAPVAPFLDLAYSGFLVNISPLMLTIGFTLFLIDRHPEIVQANWWPTR